MKALLIIFLTVYICISGNSQFLSGHYFDKNGNKFDGYLNHSVSANFSSEPDNSIEFKEKLDDKKTKLTIDQVSSFVVEGDSFSIIRNFSINSFAYYSQDFVQVIESGEINLYLHHTTKSALSGGIISAPSVGIILSSIHVTPLMVRDNKVYRMRSAGDQQENFPILFKEAPELIPKKN